MNPDYYVKRVELNTGDESEYPQENQSVQSAGQPKPAKDFKKILSKSQKEHKDEMDKKKLQHGPQGKDFKGEEQIALKETKDDEENASDVASMSLFDLSKKAGHVKKAPLVPVGKQEVEQIAKVQSPSDLFKTVGAKEPKKAFVEVVMREEPVAAPVAEKKLTSNYTQEQPDLSYVNPFAGALQPQAVVPTSEPKIERAAPLTPALRELIDQIVKQMYTVTTHDDKTDTVMTIQYPPLFKDARVVVSAYESARGQFNIAFENLSQAAQRILDLEENRRSLINALEQKGYNVQLLTTTTIMEPRLNVDEPYAQQQQKQDDQGGGQSQDQQQRKRKQQEQNPYA